MAIRVLMVRRERKRHVGGGQVERDRHLFDETPEDFTRGQNRDHAALEAARSADAKEASQQQAESEGAAVHSKRCTIFDRPRGCVRRRAPVASNP